MTSKSADRLRKRYARQVTLENGEVFYVRTPTVVDHRRIEALETSGAANANLLTGGLFYALTLCEDADATPIYPKADGETDAQLAERVRLELEDVPPETMTALREAMEAATKPARPEQVLKN